MRTAKKIYKSADSAVMSALVGLLDDGDLTRPAQGEFEERDSLP